MKNSIIDLLEATPWSSAVFTTYSLSLSFFESVVLDALVRGNCRETSILSDVDGVRMALGELGARRVGKEYRVEPIKARRGVFHPKVTTLIAEDDAHVLVGSGNLTFGGWGQNLEVIEHLHPSFASQAFRDLADFYDALSISDVVMHEADDLCAATAEQIRKIVSSSPENGEIRIFSNLETSLFEQLAEHARDLGGAKRLTIVSPYSDGGKAIDRLCSELGLDSVQLHAPESVAKRIKGFSWPFNAKAQLIPVSVDAIAEEAARPFHAKMYEIICEKGRILVSGSPNATEPALSARTNVELCVTRLQRERHSTWSFSNALPPIFEELEDSEIEDSFEDIGILRAELIADKLAVRVFSPVGIGSGTAYLNGSRGLEPLCNFKLDDDNCIEIDAPQLEIRSWQGERLTLRLESQDGQVSEGFISVSAFQNVKRRAGAAAPSIFAILAGTEAPEDVAAMLAWFQENPDAINLSSKSETGGGEGVDDFKAEPNIRVDHLNKDHARDPRGERVSFGGSDLPGWRRFIELLYSALQERRGPIGFTPTGDSAEDMEETEGEGGADFNEEMETHYLRASRAYFELDRLVDNFTGERANSRSVSAALYVCLYVCDRLAPEQERVTGWFGKIIRALSKISPEGELLNDGAAATTIYAASVSLPNPPLFARNILSRMGFTRFDEPPSFKGVEAYSDLMKPLLNYQALWAQVQTTTTMNEQRAIYLQDLETGVDRSDQYPDFLERVGELSPRLLEAITDPTAKARIHFVDEIVEACPKHHRSLPVAQRSNLRIVGVASPKSCCGSLIVLRDGRKADD